MANKTKYVFMTIILKNRASLLSSLPNPKRKKKNKSFRMQVKSKQRWSMEDINCDVMTWLCGGALACGK